ncbi:MAG: hypothetical protein RR382_00995 [Tannerellaceae bacterium]
MTQQEHIDVITSLLPQFTSTNDPASVLVKYATEHNMTPALLQRLGHVFNTFSTIDTLSHKEASAKGADCVTVDVPSMLEDYTTYDPERYTSNATDKINKRLEKHTDAYMDWAHSKSASHRTAHQLGDNQHERMLPLEDLFSMQDEAVKAASAPEVELSPVEQYFIQRDNMNKAATVFDGYVTEMNEKMASLAKRIDKMHDWTEIHQDISDLLGEDSKMVFAKIANWYANRNTELKKVDVADYTPRYFAQDRHGIEKEARAIVDGIVATINYDAMIKESGIIEPPRRSSTDQYTDADIDAAADAAESAPNYDEDVGDAAEKKKRRETGRDPYTSGGVGKGSKTPRDPKVTPGKTRTDELVSQMGASPASGRQSWNLGERFGRTFNNGLSTTNDLIDDVKQVMPTVTINDVYGTARTILRSIKPDENKRQKLIDEAAVRARQDGILQQLVLTDPIISRADPDTVNDLANSIASINPTFASNAGLMAMALREALQYGDGIPMNQARDLIDTEKATVSTQKDREQIRKSKYTSGTIKKKDSE